MSAKTGTFAVTVYLQGTGVSQKEGAGPASNTTSPGTVVTVTLGNGDTGIASSTTQMGALLIPVAGSTPAIGLLGQLADTMAIPLDQTYPSFVPIDPSNTTWYVQAGSVAPIQVVTV